jgi:exopolyphosphatase
MFPVPREDLHLRTDAIKLFEFCDLNTANVACSGDLNLPGLQQEDRLKLTLVDHSVPSLEERDVLPSVVEVLDHGRQDDGGSEEFDASVEKRISPVGSCSTLIADDLLNEKREALEENEDLAKLLLGVILLDTDNLSPTTGLATDKDRDVVVELAKLTDADCDGLFSDLMTAKLDTSGLSAYDLLRRDYKDAPPSTRDIRAGGSTVTERNADFFIRKDAISSLQQFIIVKGIGLLLVDHVFYADSNFQQRQRQILIYCHDSKLCQSVSKYLAAVDMLGLKEISQHNPNIRIFDQANLVVSRERLLELISIALSQEVLPSFKSFINDISSVQIAHRISQSKLGTVHVVLGSPACDVPK